jgi:hypothetical protein
LSSPIIWVTLHRKLKGLNSTERIERHRRSLGDFLDKKHQVTLTSFEHPDLNPQLELEIRLGLKNGFSVCDIFNNPSTSNATFTGLPDGIFLFQESKFGYILEGFAMKNVGII